MHLMQWVNRRRLLVAALLAAVFAWLLPYLIFLGPNLPRPPEITSISGNLTQVHSASPFSESTHLTWDGGPPTPQDLADISRRTSNTAPPDAFTSWGGRGEWISVEQFGWPFRALNMCSRSHRVAGIGNRTSTIWHAGGIDFPAGVRWSAMLANVSLFTLATSALYCAAAIRLARRRINRGMCFRCGYILNGATTCPDCGSTSPRIRRSPRLRKTIKWGITLIAAAILFLWIGSLWFKLLCAGPNRAVVIEVTCGAVEFRYYELLSRTGTLGIQFQRFPSAQPMIWKFSVGSAKVGGRTTSGMVLLIPLWAPFLLFAVGAAAAWRADLRIARRANIACINCDYDITGLIDEIKCPECGAGIPKRQ